MVDILKCHGKKCTCAINFMNTGCIQFRWIAECCYCTCWVGAFCCYEKSEWLLWKKVYYLKLLFWYVKSFTLWKYDMWEKLKMDPAKHFLVKQTKYNKLAYKPFSSLWVEVLDNDGWSVAVTQCVKDFLMEEASSLSRPMTCVCLLSSWLYSFSMQWKGRLQKYG